MERYLKEEPKSNFGNRKLPSDDLDMSWDLFAPPESPLNWKMEVNPLCLNKLNLDQQMDSLSTTSSSSSCSRLSWDASLSYAVLVKNEPIDTDYEDNSDSYEEHYSSSSEVMNNNNNNIKYEKSERRNSAESQNAIKFTIVARSQLTPPSSPEPNSKKSENVTTNNNNNGTKNRKSLVRMAMNPDNTQLSRNTIVKLTTSKNSSIGVARLIQVHPKFQTTATISSESKVNIVNPPCKFLTIPF